MAQNLDNHLPPSHINFNPGFAVPGIPQYQPWSPWIPPTDSLNPPAQRMRTRSTSSGPAPSFVSPNLSFSPAPSLAPPPSYSPPKASSPPSAIPSLTAPLPTVPALQSSLPSIQNPSHDPTQKIIWARDVLFLVDKQSGSISSSSTDTPVGPAIIQDPALLRLVQVAVPVVLSIASAYQGSQGQGQTPAYIAEALYLRATFEASGAYPEHIKHNPRSAFRDFETAARAGYAAAWFRLGRDYENFNDAIHARDCFERGVKLGVESCAYRMGMAHLMGQLGLPANPTLALPLLHRAATLSTPQVPQPAYVYALLLLSEFTQLPSPLPISLFSPFIPQSSSPPLEARKHLERAAYLGFPPAQYKLGHAYEFAQVPFPFDPLLSVQYYSLASQQGEVEADMALSKWFLCGSGDGAGGEGGFEKDEALALTFAEKAARRGLPSAEFAMGYYAEVGVGGTKDLGDAVRWYTKAKEHGNKDAADRLSALSQDTPQALSRQEHDAITENKLVRKRTMAKERSDNQQSPLEYNPPLPTLQHSQYQQHHHHPQQQQQQPLSQQHPSQHQRPPRRQVLENVRKSSMMIPTASGHPTPPPQTQPQPQPHPYARPQPPGGTLARPLSQPQVQAQVPGGAKRYTLTDGQMPSTVGGGLGGGPGGGVGGRKSPAGLGRGKRMGSGPSVGTGGGGGGGGGGEGGGGGKEEIGEVGLGGGVVYSAKPSKGPTTFAEMGFQGAKAEDKECVVM